MVKEARKEGLQKIPSKGVREFDFNHKMTRMANVLGKKKRYLSELEKLKHV